jgi:transposase
MQYLVAGDVFVVDNSRIHTAAHIMPLLNAVLTAAGVAMRLLPKYSPEFNPCENIFGQVKRALRESRSSAPFLAEMTRAFAVVSHANVVAYYRKCVDEWDIA